MDSSLFVETDDSPVEEIPNYYLKYNYDNQLVTSDFLNNIFKKYNLTYDNKNYEIFVNTFTHISYCNDLNNITYVENTSVDKKQLDIDLSTHKLVDLQPSSYEELEWGGDSAIGLVISLYLFYRFPNENEGFLTKLRATLTNCENLAKMSKILNLDKYMLISNFIESIHGRQNNNKLQEVFKAFIAAVDNTYSIYDRNQFIINLFESHTDFADKIINDRNYKHILIQYYDKHNLTTPKFRVEMIEGPPNNRIFTIAVVNNNNEVIAIAKDPTKKKGEQKASEIVLRDLNIISNDNIIHWSSYKHVINPNMLIQHTELYYYKYNSKNIKISAEFINTLLHKYGITKSIRNLEKYQEAFIHKSYCKINVTKTDIKLAQNRTINKNLIHAKLTSNELVDLNESSYERFEWFGDSVLKYVITKYLSKRYGANFENGFLSQLRSKLINTSTLAQLSQALDFSKYIILAYNEEQSNLRINQSVLEDVCEAFFGALTLDLGESITEQFIINIYEANIDIADNIKQNTNYKDTLLRYYHTMKWSHPIYKQLNVEHTNTDAYNYSDVYTVAVYDNTENNIVGIGKAKSKKSAEQMASKKALEHFNQTVNNQDN